ncbi:MAG: response regulator [Spirochaetales bacterium]|nr:response regulator [Spirochaetales bacterium]
MADKKILIIDDDPDIIEPMKVVLESRGYKIETAMDSKKGLEKADSFRPNLIILDVMMETNQAGFEAARVLKQSDLHKNTPIIMLTAVKEKTGINFKDAAGDEAWLPVDDFCDKPLKPDQLLDKVSRFIG